MSALPMFPVEARAIELWDWQSEAVEALRRNIRNGINNQVLVSPTGSGKTVISTYLVEECYGKFKRAVFVCDRIPLIAQTSETFDEYGIPHGVIQADHWRTDGTHRIQIASAQTLVRRGWPEADLIIVDEAHTVHKTVAERIALRDVVTIGLTATPFTRGLGKLYDSVVTVRTLNQLTIDEYLAPFDAFAASEPDMTGAKTVAGEWTDEEAERRAMPIIGDAVSEYLEKAAGKKFIAFGVNVAHCEELQRQFMAAGVNVALYTYRTGDEERKEMIREFKRRGGYLTGLISVAALSKGFDAPTVECIIMCRPLRSSLAEHIQILGRGLRRDPDNPSKRCTVLDHSGNMLRFWKQMHVFFEYGTSTLDDGKRKPKKKAESKEPEPIKCPKCASVHKPRPTCPNCGHEYPRRSGIEHLPGKLVALGSAKHEDASDLRADVFAQLRYVAQERGYKLGWAAHQFETLFGDFSSELWKVAPRPPTQKTQNWVRSQLIRYAKGRAKGNGRQ